MAWGRYFTVAVAVAAAFYFAAARGDALAASRHAHTATSHHHRGHIVTHRSHRVSRKPHLLKAGLRAEKGRCRKHRSCRARRSLLEAYVPPAVVPTPPAPIVPPEMPVRDATRDIFERERDIPIILSVASTLRGYRVEHAVSIVEARLADEGISYRLVQGALDERTQDSAELAQIALAPNERLVADVHSHPQIKAASRAVADIALARTATLANFYPGLEDFGAMVQRGVVSAIVDPDGGVMLLRRIGGDPSIRKVDGAPLEALDEVAANRLEVSYLYTQGYLMHGDWVRPAIVATLHAGP